MRTYKKYILGAAVLSVAALTGCKDKMRELNTNPNLMTSALPEYQFLGATQDWGFFGRGWPASRAGNIGALMQVSVWRTGSNPYVNPTTWSGGNMSFMNNYYDRYYSGGKGLNSIVTYIDKMEDPVDRQRYADIRAIARLLQMHEAWTVFTNYGAMVFSEAFQAQSEKIIKPAYDVYSKEAGIYKQLDDSVKMCIAQLASPMFGDAVALGRYDGFYGLTYTTKAEGGATWTENKPEVQREKWLKFATTLRVKMALALRNVDPGYYQSVIGEVRQFVTENPNAMMSQVQDGCQFILPNTYNRDDGNQAGFYYCMPVSFVNSMKLAEDPRLPLVVTPTECDINYDQYYKFVATYYPDSLLYKSVYDPATQKRELKSWNGMLTQKFNGRSLNPANNNKPTAQPGTLINTQSVTFRLYHPDYKNPDQAGISAEEKEAREKHNATLKNAKLENYFTGVTEDAVIYNKYSDQKVENTYTNGVCSFSVRIVSGLQNRHYVANSGNGITWSNGRWEYNDDKPSQSDIKLATKVLSYAEHCFLMALICNYDGGVIGGKDAAAWYEEGIRASMQETVEDAERVYVQICTNTAYPALAGVNSDANGENKKLYKIDKAMTDAYLANPLVQLTGGADEITNKIMLQMWLANWQKPENTWFYYKATGYPRTVNYPWEVADYDTGLPQAMGFEQPYLASGEQMVWPRHVVVSLSDVENEANWYDMQTKLLEQKEPAYAPNGWSDYSGRVFWDVVQPAGLAN